MGDTRTAEKIEKQYEKALKLVDTKITTHHIEHQTYFVLTGFKKGIEMHSGEFA